MAQADSTNTTTNGVALPPRKKPLRIDRLKRRRMEAIVENLLALLDEDAGDPDLEDGGDDEPSLGSGEVTVGRAMVDGSAIWPDQVQVTDAGFDQTHWVNYGDRDLEDEHDGREPDLAMTDSEMASGIYSQLGRKGLEASDEDIFGEVDDQNAENGAPTSKRYRERLRRRRCERVAP